MQSPPVKRKTMRGFSPPGRVGNTGPPVVLLLVTGTVVATDVISEVTGDGVSGVVSDTVVVMVPVVAGIVVNVNDRAKVVLIEVGSE